jgi:hypothetical protein
MCACSSITSICGRLCRFPSLEVIRIVRRRHLHCARAELRLRQFIGDDRNLPLHQRQQNMLAVQMRVALIFRIHRDRRIAQHGLRPRGRHRNELIRPHHRIANLPQLPCHVLVLYFQIRDRRLAPRTPVHNVLAAINQPFFIQPDEHFAHRARKVLVHGEILAVPVDRRAQPLHLVENRAPVELFHSQTRSMNFSRPRSRRFLPSFARCSLHHHLRGDPGVIRPRQPQRDEPAHAMPAHNNVHLRLVQHVPHVQPPGNIRRRQQQREYRTRLALRRRGHREEFFFDPVLGPARFNRARLVGFGQFVRHRI